MVEDRHPDRLEAREEDGAALAGDLLQRDPRLEQARVGEAGAAGVRRQHRRPAGDVEHRQRRPEAVPGAEAEAGCDGLALGEQRGVGVQAALRVGGGAGGVHDADGILRGHCGFRLEDLGEVDRLVSTGEDEIIAEHGDAGLGRQPGFREERLEARRGDQQAEAGVGADVAEFTCLVAGVERDADGAEAGRSQSEREVVGADLAEQDADPVAAGDAGRAQSAGREQRALRELAVRQLGARECGSGGGGVRGVEGRRYRAEIGRSRVQRRSPL